MYIYILSVGVCVCVDINVLLETIYELLKYYCLKIISIDLVNYLSIYMGS